MLCCAPAQKPTTGEITGPGVEPLVIVLLDDHVIRLPCKWLSLSSQTWAALNFGQRNFLLQGVAVRAKAHKLVKVPSISKSWVVGESSRLTSLPPRLRQHGRRHVQNLRAGGWKEELANADSLTWRGHCTIDMHVLTWPCPIHSTCDQDSQNSNKDGRALLRPHPSQSY